MKQTNPSLSLRFNTRDTHQREFYLTLRQRVDSYFKTNRISRNSNTAMVLKTVTLLFAYVGSFIAVILLQPSFFPATLLYAIMGFSVAGIGMSVMHDANHGSYSKDARVNRLLGLTLNLLGGSVINWKHQHNVLHHTFTNIDGHDEDIEDKVMMRFSPHSKVNWYHRGQYIYAFVFYCLLTLYWVVGKDFVQYARYRKSEPTEENKKWNFVILMRIITLKIVYLFTFLGLPVALGMPAMTVITGFFIMHAIAGLVLTVVFQLAHTVEGTTHPLPDENLTIENNWAIHQLHTTVNFATGNRFLSWYLGGLNYQVEHHLFPSICHVHYPALSAIVQSTAKEFGMPYKENTTLLDAVRSHVKLLRKLGTERIAERQEVLA